MASNLSYPSLNTAKVVNVWPTLHSLLDEGTLYVATNPTPLTAIATTTSVVNGANSGATSAQTRPVAVLFNNNPTASNICVYPLTWNWQLTAVPTSSTSWQLGIWLDPLGANAYSSGGSLIVPQALNPMIPQPSKCLFYFGAITANPTSAAGSLVARRMINATVPVALDQWMMVFGGTVSSDQLSAGTNAKTMSFNLPPIAIPPQYALKVGMFGAANAGAPSWEFECVFAERAFGQ